MLRLILLILFLMPLSPAQASIVKQMSYEYSHNAAKDLVRDNVYVVCDDCQTSGPLALAPKVPSIAARVPEALPLKRVHKTEEPQKVPEGTIGHEPEAVHARKFTSAVATVYFPFASYCLSSSEKGKLREIARMIKDKEVTEVSVKGYTCDIGKKSYNDALAKRRAEAVAEYLTGKGIDVSEISGEGKCCYVSKIKKLNRRVDVISVEEVLHKGH